MAIQHARGVKLLLKVDFGAGFVGICTINAARGIDFTSASNDFVIPADCDDLDAIAWVAREKVSLSVGITGAGIVNTPDVEQLFDWWKSSDTLPAQVIVDVPAGDGGIIFEGSYHLTDFGITGDRGAKMEANITLASDGEITATANS